MDEITKEIQAISEQLAAALRRQLQNGNGSGCRPPEPGEHEGFLKFSIREVSRMPKDFKRKMRAEGCTVHFRKRIRGKNSCSYEARYRRNGYNISVSAKTVPELKERFITALHNAETQQDLPTVPTNFNEFAQYYFETFKKRKVSKKTFESDLRRYNRYILPTLGSMPVKKITPMQCQKIVDEIMAAGHSKTAEDICSTLNGIFKSAQAHYLIERNPLAIVYREPHEREHGKALSLEEEHYLLSTTAGNPYQLMFAVALYTGLRPNEYRTARIEGEFIVAVNSKRKNRKVEYKKIPITPMLRPYLEGVQELKFFIPECMRAKFKAILPEHKLYDLRTTFYTRCQECGVAQSALMEFVGHSRGKLGNAYTDLSDDFLLLEGKKLKY